MEKLHSWGRYPYHPQDYVTASWQEDISRAIDQVCNESTTTLPFGNGRSYGDSCLAASDRVIRMTTMDHLLEADWEKGVIRAQAGLLLSELINIALPRGWFLAVTPGTKFVTLGGAIANDVHGKNHHVRGTFGNHVRRLGLYRSNEGYIECGPDEQQKYFEASVAGLGLTGVILWVELQLIPVNSSEIEVTSIVFKNLDEYFELAREQDAKHEYTVAWIDCLAKKEALGRGHYIIGDHAVAGRLEPARQGRLSVPITPPFSLINHTTLHLFNTLYYHRQQRKVVHKRTSYDPFFYPLDSIHHWNRIYGRQGFQQYQCAIPATESQVAIKEILAQIASHGTGSFLAVLKQFGEIDSPGLLSFPLHGSTLALDFPERDSSTQQLFDRLDAVVAEAGGRLYPAKDAHMDARFFQNAFPLWHELEKLRDPVLMSHFWKRVSQ